MALLNCCLLQGQECKKKTNETVLLLVLPIQTRSVQCRASLNCVLSSIHLKGHCSSDDDDQNPYLKDWPRLLLCEIGVNSSQEKGRQTEERKY